MDKDAFDRSFASIPMRQFVEITRAQHIDFERADEFDILARRSSRERTLAISYSRSRSEVWQAGTLMGDISCHGTGSNMAISVDLRLLHKSIRKADLAVAKVMENEKVQYTGVMPGCPLLRICELDSRSYLTVTIEVRLHTDQ